jgi:hypothetical protein
MLERIVIVALAILVAGCHGVVRKDFDAAGNPGEVKIGDPALKGIVKIVRADSEVVDGHLNVRILLHNRTPLRRELEYKVVFVDQEGFPLEDRWGWRPLNLEPGGDEVIEVKSFFPAATGYQLQLQRASTKDMR